MSAPDEPAPAKAPDPFEDDPFADDPFAAAPRPKPKGSETEPDLPAIQVEPKPKVALPPPAKIAPGTQSGDTSITGAPLPPPRLQALPLVVAACLLLVLGVTIGGVFTLNAIGRDAEKQGFLRYAKRHDPEASLLAYGRLPESVQRDADVLRLKEQLEARHSGETARREAEDLLEGFDLLKDDAARITACTQAIEADPRFAAAYVQRARYRARAALRAAADADSPAAVFQDALTDLEAALDIEPARPDALFLRAQLVLRCGAEEEARQLLIAASKATSGVGTLARGWSMLLAGNLRSAQSSFAAAARRKTPWIVNAARIGEARALLELGDDAGIKALADRARRADPEAAEPHWLLAEAAAPTAPKDARAHLEQALAADPLSARALALRGSLALQAGEADAAERAGRRSVDLDPDGALGHLVLARCLDAKGRSKDALNHAQRAAQHARVPRDRVSSLLLQVRLRVGLRAQGVSLDVPKTLESLGEVLDLDPANLEAPLLRARLRAEQGDRKGALEDLSRAMLEHGSHPPDAYLLQARLLLEERPPPIPRVLACLTSVLSQDPDHAEAHLLQARAYVLAARYEDALRSLAKAGEEDPARVALLRGDARYGLGQWREALAAYRAYLPMAKEGPDAARARKRSVECVSKSSGSGSDF